MVLPVQTYTDPLLSQPIQPHGIAQAMQTGVSTYSKLQQAQLAKQQAAYYAAKAGSPLMKMGISSLSGPAASQASADVYSQLHGAQDPRTIQIQRALKTGIDLKQRMAQFYGMPMITKLQNIHQQQVQSGDTSAAHETSAAITKQIGDPDAQKQYEALSGISNEMGTVDFDSIKQYAGPMGKTKLLYDEAKASMGFGTPPAYQNYVVFKKQAKGMTDQLRKGLGTSIRNQYVKTMLLPLIDNLKKTWGQNPELAKAQWDWAKGWINRYQTQYAKYATEGLTKEDVHKKILADKSMQMTPPGMQSPRTGITKRIAVKPGWDAAGTLYTAKDGRQYTLAQIQGGRK